MPEAYKRALGMPDTPISSAIPGPFPTTDGISARGSGMDDRGYDRYRDRDRDRDRDYRDHRDNYRDRDRDRDQREVIGESRQLTFGNDLRAQQFVPAT